jgi:glycosyltransferase involved in cell wall biosynthesis
LKILQICAAYKPAYIYGGPTMSVSKLSEALVKGGSEIQVFATTANGADELPVQAGEATYVDGVKVTYFKRVTGDHTHYSPDLLMAVRQKVKQFDVVHIHAWWNLVSVLACRIAIKEGIPVVVSPRGTLSDYSFSNKNVLSKKVIHSLLGKGLLLRSYIHVTSEQERQAMELLIKPKKIFNIPNFITLPEQTAAIPEGKSDPLKLIFFSRIDKKKGLELLLDALKNIGISYRLTIAGDGDVAYIAGLKALSIKNGVEIHTNWIGFKTNDKFDILQRHDLFVLPSYDENFGNSVIESLSVGTAVIVSNKVGLSDYIRKNHLGWVCNQEVSSLREHIITASGNGKELLRIRKEGPATILTDFNEAGLTEKYLSMYTEIIDNGRI